MEYSVTDLYIQNQTVIERIDTIINWMPILLWGFTGLMVGFFFALGFFASWRRGVRIHGD